jgi:hypothetical protein
MIFGLVRRAFGLACLVLVGWAAVKVPIGRRTAWGHAVAIFTTAPAREAAEDIENAAIDTLRNGGNPAGAPNNAIEAPKGAPSHVTGRPEASATEPSQGPPPRGKTPTPGNTHVRSAQQGVSPGS